MAAAHCEISFVWVLHAEVFFLALLIDKREVIYFSILFYKSIVPLGILLWEIRVAFPGESQLQQSRVTQPTVHAEFVSVSNPPNSDIDFKSFNVRI